MCGHEDHFFIDDLIVNEEGDVASINDDPSRAIHSDITDLEKKRQR